MNVTTIAIRMAHAQGSLAIAQREGRFGPFWAILDGHGTIEIHDSEQEAKERLCEALGLHLVGKVS